MQDYVRCHAHKILLLSPVHSLVNAVHTLSSFFRIHVNIILPSSEWLLSFKPPHQLTLCPHFTLPTCPAPLFP